MSSAILRIRNFLSLAEILDWTPTTRSEDQYCRASVPLKKTYTLTSTNDSTTHYLTPNEPRPKLMVCHDYGGGKKEDTYYQGYPEFPAVNESIHDDAKTFQIHDWDLIDHFVYFTHDTLTLPPPGWTNLAHKHGTKSLGVLIFEGKNEGLKDCLKVLRDPEISSQLINQMVDIAAFFRFDGYLLNFEVNLTSFEDVEPMMDALKTFVSVLTDTMHERLPFSEVIWYDAITVKSDLTRCGALAWQDQLTSANQPFFDRSDGILLNYFWKEETLKCDFNASFNSQYQRNIHVFKGIDVFARGAPAYKEGLDCVSAVDKIKQEHLSCGLFAPGYFYQRCPANQNPVSYSSQFWKAVRKAWNSRNVISEIPFMSNFCRGRGKMRFIQGSQWTLQPWFDLSLQDVLPIEDYEYDEECAFSGGSSLKLQGKPGETLSLFPLYDAHIEVNEYKEVILSLKAVTESPIGIYITISNNEDESVKSIVVCNSANTAQTHSEELMHHLGHSIEIIEASFQPVQGSLEARPNSGFFGQPPKHNFARMKADIKLKDLKIGSFIRKIGVLGWSPADDSTSFRANLGQVLITSPEVPKVKVEPLSVADFETYPSEKRGDVAVHAFFSCRLNWMSSASHHAVFYDKANADGQYTDTFFIGLTTSQEGLWVTRASIAEPTTGAKLFVSYMDSNGDYTNKALSPVFNVH